MVATTKEAALASIAHKNFDNPDDARTPEKTRVEIVDLGAVKAGRFTMQPGWRWSSHIKPVVGTTTCQARHVGAVASGQLHVIGDDGFEADLVPGDAYLIEPGHDAWVIGDEPFVGYEFETKTAENYATPQ
ncbi:MAG: Cupin 2 conserved barrel domain protein [Actinomycetia bacterium]|nr:Cupin 2 conserved barrel domain protein [Actinomycetes bacterium]